MMKILLRYRSLGIQARLSMLAAATALPLVVLAGFAILQMVEDQRTQMQQDVENRVEPRSSYTTRRDSSFSARTGRLASRFLAPPIPKCMTASLQRVSLRFPT